MNILIPILGFEPSGGVRVLTELANSWAKMGHRCAFLVPAGSVEPYFPVDAEILCSQWRGVSEGKPNPRRPSRVPALLALFLGIRAVNNQFDVVLANHCLTAWAVWLAAAKNNLKFYYIQAYEPEYYSVFVSPFKHLLARLSYFLPLQQIANANTYRARGIKPIEVIPPGVDLSIFTPKPAVDRLPLNQLLIGTVGRKEPFKGTRYAVDAFRILKRIHPDWKMRVAIGNVEPSESVEIAPIRSDLELAEFYRSIDILLVTCVGQHGAPHYPVIEAMASGTPVVHTGYFPGGPENSYEAAPADPDSVASVVIRALNDEHLKGKISAGRNYVADNLGWASVSRRFIEIFSSKGAMRLRSERDRCTFDTRR